MSMVIKIDNNVKIYSLSDAKVGDVFSFKDSLWGINKNDFFLVTNGGYVHINNNWTYYSYGCFEDCFSNSSSYGDDEEWDYFVDNLDTYQIVIYDSTLTLKKRP